MNRGRKFGWQERSRDTRFSMLAELLPRWSKKQKQPGCGGALGFARRSSPPKNSTMERVSAGNATPRWSFVHSEHGVLKNESISERSLRIGTIKTRCVNAVIGSCTTMESRWNGLKRLLPSRAAIAHFATRRMLKAGGFCSLTTTMKLVKFVESFVIGATRIWRQWKSPDGPSEHWNISREGSGLWLFPLETWAA